MTGQLFPDRRATVAALLAAGLTSCRTSPTSERMHVRLAVTRSSFLFLPVYLAGPLGYFDDERLSVSIDETASAPNSAKALVGGSTDVAAGGLLSVLMLAADGQRAQAFMVMQDRPGFVVVVSPRAAHPIRRIEDLKGANVGVSSPGSDFHLLFSHILVRHGLSPDDIQPIIVGSGSAHAAALERGIVDVGLAAGTTIPILEKRHPGLAILLDTRTGEGTRAQFGVDRLHLSVLYARTQWLERHQGAARKITRSMRRAVAWIKSHSPDEVRAKLPESIRTEDDVDADAIRFTSPMLSEDGRLQPELVKLDWSVLTSLNLTKRFAGHNMPDAYTNRFL